MVDLDLQAKSIELWREETWKLHTKLRGAEDRIKKLEAALRAVVCYAGNAGDDYLADQARKALDAE